MCCNLRKRNQGFSAFVAELLCKSSKSGNRAAPNTSLFLPIFVKEIEVISARYDDHNFLNESIDPIMDTSNCSSSAGVAEKAPSFRWSVEELIKNVTVAAAMNKRVCSEGIEWSLWFGAASEDFEQ
ncbi:hypothetical protein ACH5RR_011947 [Cinchona calisaya]|uniref:Uncharacterized protein n=1 Tax=Cinchona calisaya TaxID=153742 RepID=A0ABD3A8V7_9GENT